MAERPILFTAPMVRAILAGRKTQTRRIAKEFAGRDDLDAILRRFPNQNGCPHGQPGDRLWVRETWAYGIHALAARRDEDGPFVYAADGTTHGRLCERWRPSIHMPRFACRLLLDVAAVRVERLQDISEADAQAEGAAPAWLDADDNETVHAHQQPTYRQGFARLWREINGPESWKANPWVWVIEFRRADTDKKEM